MSSLTQDSRGRLLSRIRAEQSERWQRGETVRVEDYVAQYPDLGSDANALCDLIRAELRHRHELGESVPLEEYLARFPQHADTLRRAWPLLPSQSAPPWADSNGPRSTLLETPNTSPIGAPYTSAPALPGLELYEIVGEGGMGVVFRARDVRLDRPRAIKLIRRGPLAGARAHDRFNREARAVARLDHAGVVRIYALGEHAGALYICMEFLDGGSLRARLQDGPLEFRVAADLVRQLALAVQHAHEQRVVHRDLKPANVLFTSDGLPKISDFGLAKLLDATDDLTETGAVMGTPAYMAPEQAAGRLDDIGERTDLWSLGVILYECLTGRPPFRGSTRSETLEQVKKQAPMPLRHFRAEVPASLEAICLQCLKKQPAQRYASASQLAADLRDWLDGKPINAPMQQGRRRWVGAACASVLLAVLTVGTWLLIANRQPDPPVELAPVVESAPMAGVWQPLLTREPAMLCWPAPGKNSHKQYLPATQSLVVSCEDLGLLGLGKTTASRYHLATTVQQNPWIGNIGLFFGYQDCLVGKAPGYRCQVLEFAADRGQDQGRRLRLSWSTFYFVAGAHRPKFIQKQAESQPFLLTPAEHRLELAVGPVRQFAVSLDDAPLPLGVAHAGPPPDAATCEGEFGIYVHNGNGVFRNTLYLFHGKPQ